MGIIREKVVPLPTIKTFKYIINMKKRNLTSALLIAMAALTWSCTDNRALSLDLDDYRPIDEFVDAYEAISTERVPGATYDLEKTIRVVNAIELAQMRSENFDEFLDFMARQDYTHVDPRVLDAKRKLFPILQRTYELKRDNEQLSDAWMLIRGATKGGETLVKNTSGSEALRIMHGDIFALLGIISGEDADQSTNEAFAQYEKDKELKSKIQEDLDELKGMYRQYLQEYTVIYNEYMNKYDSLCLEKDKAYLAIYGGQAGEALRITDNILRQYPNNSEAMLLNAMSNLLIGATENARNGNNRTIVNNPEVSLPDSLPQPETPAMNRYFRKAQQTLAQYNAKFPGKTAPANLLEGLLQKQLGNEAAAIRCFNLAGQEYPRQAIQLTDMLDSYNMRNYKTQTAEGLYLRRLYASTMEGCGLFSPNLQKAKLYADKGDMENSKKEIHDHFFRRINQGVYDELLSDMQFCEENLYAPFNDLLFEPSYLDVRIKPESEWLFWDSDHVMDVTISNHSDVSLENVRVFLCIHYTDMYQDEYDVIKVPKSAGRLEAHSTADLDTVGLYYPGKTYDDIAHIRAIVVADREICWVDNVGYKKDRILEALRGGRNNVSQQQEEAREEYLRHYSLDPNRLMATLRDGIKVLPPEDDPAEEKGWWDSFTDWFSSPDNKLKIELPRVLSKTNPVFTLNPIDHEDAISPESNEIFGTRIRLQFNYEPAYEEVLSLYIYNDVQNYKVDIIYRGDRSEVRNIQNI